MEKIGGIKMDHFKGKQFQKDVIIVVLLQSFKSTIK